MRIVHYIWLSIYLATKETVVGGGGGGGNRKVATGWRLLGIESYL